MAGIHILQWNCNGLAFRKTELIHHIESVNGKYHVICLQETFLKPGIMFYIPGYNIVRCDRLESAKGGLITLVKEGLNFSEVKVDTDIEYIDVKLSLKDFSLQIINIYITPGKILSNRSMECFSLSSKTIIVGDLNGKSNMWGSETPDERGRVLEEFIESKGAVVINSGQPTYQHYSGSQSHLDVAIVSSDLHGRTSKLECVK